MSADLGLPTRLLMGSGPTNPDPRVLRAMASPLVGQFDPAFTALMGETQERLRQVFRTRNRRAFPVPETSRAGMEAAVVSLVEPGERVLVVENGRFGLLFAFGAIAGRVWRIGTMAGNARRGPVVRTLTALAESLGGPAHAALAGAIAAADERFAALAPAASAA
jgi:aspartate aminotransferase-like enzyme